MKRVVGCALLALFVLAAIAEAGVPKSPCNNLKAAAPNGKKRTVNFDFLADASVKQPFQAFDPQGPWTYEFGVCTNVQCGSIGQVGACQETQQPMEYSLGVYPGVAAYSTDYPKGAITFTLAPVGTPQRGSVITVICDPKGKAKYVSELLIFASSVL